MRLNTLGQAVHGELTPNVDGVALFPGVRATSPDWLSDTEIGYQVQRAGRWYLEACEVKTKSVRVLDQNPANVFTARSGVWAAWGPTGIRSNVHPSLPMAGLWGVGWDGALGYCRSQQLGTGLLLRSVDGIESEYAIGSPVHDAHIVTAETAAYVSRGRLQTVGMATPVTVPEAIYQPRLIEMPSGAWWVLYHTSDRLLLQPVTDPVGYVVVDTPTTFDPDAVAIGPTTIRVVWSTTQGAGAAAFQRRDIDLTDVRVALTPEDPEPPPPQPRPRITIQSYDPQSGPAPLTVRAVRALAGGPATRVRWRQRRAGIPAWTQVADNPARDNDHHYHFTTPGTYEIGVDVVGPGGTDGTARPRVVEVTA